MFIIRQARMEDADTLLKLARMVHFINLPPDKDIIAQKIQHSRRCFQRIAHGDDHLSSSSSNGAAGGLATSLLHSDLFMFVIEDAETGAPIGSSQLVASMGGPHRPNVRFKLDRREFFSRDLQTGTSHIVATLDLDDSSPTEIGGLILQPSFRGHKLKLGRFLALIRFHFIGLHRGLFSDRVLAEMMAPITADGHNTLWDYLGRRFIPLSYDEADRFCQTSYEFMVSMLPKTELYLSLLPPGARAVVGQVSPDTVPARRMLEKLGFEYRGFVDPFDGGPHLDCPTDDIEIVRETHTAPLGEPVATSKCKHRGFLSRLTPQGEFRAINDQFMIDDGAIRLPKSVAASFGGEPGDRIGVTIMDGPEVPRSRRPAGSAEKPVTPKRSPSKKAAIKKATTRRTSKKAARRSKS
ncbi:MAG: arginine N-succinyltransferase [Planctomycetota bacterium]